MNGGDEILGLFLLFLMLVFAIGLVAAVRLMFAMTRWLDRH